MYSLREFVDGHGQESVLINNRSRSIFKFSQQSNRIPFVVYQIKPSNRYVSNTTPGQCQSLPKRELLEMWFCQNSGWSFFEPSQKYRGGRKFEHLKGQLWPRLGHVFVYSCPTPLPGNLWPRGCHVFVYSCPDPLPWSVVTLCKWVTFLFIPALPPLPRPKLLWLDPQKCTHPNTIPARRSSLGPPPAGRHRS